jgi:hypothetical protein
MTSAIISASIDADYPVAGQDNDSQGFRDNFSIIKDGLATAAAEVTVLQSSTAKLNADNDFGGNVIDNAQTNRLYGTVYSTTSTPTTNVSLEQGEYQKIELTGNHALTFTDWPETDRYAKIKLELKSDGIAERTITFATEAGGTVRKEITQTVTSVTGANRKPSNGVAVTTATLSFPTANMVAVGAGAGAGTIQVDDVLFGTGLIGSVSVASVANISTTASATAAARTIEYTAISSVGTVTVSSSTSGITLGTPVTLSDVTGVTGLLTATTYYVFAVDVSSFRLASSYANALGSTPVADLSGSFTGTATATFPMLDPSSNVITVGSTTGMYVGMPIRFTGTGFGGVSAATDYYIISIVGSTGIRISATSGGPTLTLTSASGALAVVPTTVLTVTCSSQIIVNAAGLTLSTAIDSFPAPFTVSNDANKIKIIEAWTTDAGANIFIKYLGEYA